MVRKKKTGRRGRGEGALYQRKDRRWSGSIEIEGQGKRKRKYFYGETKQEVQDKVNTALYEQKQGKLATGPQQTVEQYLEDWLENVHKHKIRDSSYAVYRQLLNNHVLPAFGHVKLQKLTTRHIDTLYVSKLKEGYASETIRAIHRMLHAAFDDAVRWKRISSNVCDDVKPPRPEQHETQTLTKEQSKQLLEADKEHRLRALLTLALATGMRRGELLGLEWRDIDFEERSLYIQRTINRIGKKGIVVSEPKTVKSKSKIMLPQFAIDALQSHREQQEEKRKEAGKAWYENDLVFPNSIGKFLEPGRLHIWFKKLLKEAGLPDMRFHDLRHSAATILLGMGVHPKLVQELLRHSNISMTMDRYSHVLPSMQRKMMDDFDDFFGEL